MLAKSPSLIAANLAAFAHDRLKAGDRANGRAMLTSALNEDIDCAIAWRHLGAMTAAPGKHEAAIVAAKRALAIDPSDAQAWSNLGANLWRIERYSEALRALNKANSLKPNDPQILQRLALVCYSDGAAKKAVHYLERAVRLDPKNTGAKSDLSLARLKSGDLRQGLIEHEVRWETLDKSAVWDCGLPHWQGEDLTGRTILVHHEQGYGDTLQFVRFMPRLKGARVIFAAPKSLTRLLDGQCGIDEVIEIEKPGAIVQAAVRAQFHSPLLSIARVLGVTYDDIPPAPYLRAPKDGPGVKPKAGGVRVAIGLVWAASPGHQRSRQRSVPIEKIVELATVPGVKLYSLQIGPFREELERSGAGHIVTDLAPSIRDFADTAALMNELDLVISVDSGPAHLAGALGRPVWMFNPVAACWRWCRGASVWYPSMRLFDQSRPGDWSDVIATMTAELAAMTSSASP